MEPVLSPYLWIIALIAVYALALSFGVALACGSGAAGGLVAGALAAVIHALLFGAFLFHAMFPAHGSFRGLAALCGAAALGSAVLLTLAAARQGRLRGRAWLFAARQAGLILASLAVILVSTRLWIGAFVDRLVPSDAIFSSVRLDSRGNVSQSHRPIPAGRLLATLRGRFVWESSDGRRTVLVDERSERPEDVLKSPFQWRGEVFTLSDGSWWLLRETDDAIEIWSGPAASPMRLTVKLPPRPFVEWIADGPRGPELIGWNPGKIGRLRARIELKRPLRWRRF